MNQDVYHITKKAIENDEIDVLLKADNKYDCASLHELPVSIPKDWTQIIEAIIFIFNEDPSCDAQMKYLKAFYNLANGAPEDVWIAARVLLCQYVLDSRLKLNHIFSSEEIKYLNTKLHKNREQLIKIKKWLADEKKGLWADIELVAERMREDFSIELI